METGNATLYEIINKETQEVIPVVKYESGDVTEDGQNDFIVHKPEGEQVVFAAPDYSNDTYVVRQRGSKRSPDDQTVVMEDVETTPFVAEGGAAVVEDENTLDEGSEVVG